MSLSYIMVCPLVRADNPRALFHGLSACTRSLGQFLEFLEKPCVHSRRHSFDPIFMKRCQNVYPNEI